MPALPIRPGVYWVGVEDRTVDLFEGLWPVAEEGVTYNAYLIDDRVKVLVDLAAEKAPEELLRNISEVTDPAELDYIVINHMEPDHTGCLRAVLDRAPKATILASPKAVGMLASFYQVSDRVRAVKDGERLELGQHAIEFLETPFLHWPETMMTHEVTQGVLFTCDAFGGFGTLDGRLFADQLPSLDAYEREALRYYANIVSLYPKAVTKALARLEKLPLQVIAPSHGFVWREELERPLGWYRKWVQYADGPWEPGVTLLHGSMHGNTLRMVEAVARGVERAGVPLSLFDTRHAHPSHILASLYTQSGVIVASATYEAGLFPPVEDALRWAERKRILKRKAAFVGSYGWGGGGKREFAKRAEALQWEVQEALEYAGAPTPERLSEGEELGYRFAAGLAGGEVNG